MMTGPAHYKHSKRSIYVPTKPKHCSNCRQEFRKRKNESYEQYAARKACSRACADAMKLAAFGNQDGSEPWLEEVANIDLDPKVNIYGDPIQKKKQPLRGYGLAVAMSHGHGGGNW